MPTAPSSSPFARIAVAIRNRVAAALSLPLAYVRIVANDDYTVDEIEPLCVFLRFYGPQPPRDRGLDFADPGAGRLFTPFARRFRVYVHTRSGEDVRNGDEYALTGYSDATTVADTNTPGHFLSEELVYNCLNNWTPLAADRTTGDLVPLTVGPVHWMPTPDGAPLRARENDAGTIRSDLDFEAVYTLAVDRADPPA